MYPIIHEIIDEDDFVIILFCLVHDLCNVLPKQLPIKAGRKPTLTIPELITIAVVFICSDNRSFKGFVRIFKHTHFFPNLPEYSRLLRNVKEIGPQIIFLLHLLMAMNRAQSTGKTMILDTTALPVVNNKRIFNYKVTEFAARGKSSMGWFYGFKLHVLIDENGKLLNIKVTPGNVSDKNRELVKEIFEKLKGLAIADAGYVSEELQGELLKQGVLLITGVYKNMKKLMTSAQHKLMKLRQFVETVNGCIKYRKGCVSSLPRSLNGYLWRYITAVFAYALLSHAK